MILNFFKTNIRYFAILVFVVSVVFFFDYINHIENQGFNPSDDGVILAQSYRIINGEIPHLDFISIRPVASGVLHSIHFFSPLPLMIAARYFVLFQFFVIAFFISLTVSKVFAIEFKQKIGNVGFVALFITCFSLSALNYNLYPWTTIDAVFWSTIGLYFVFQEKNPIKIILGLIAFSFAALSRQSFILVAFAMFYYVIYYNYKRLARLLLMVLVGFSPFIIYFLLLIYHSALDLFITQMTGRTELVETGLYQFAKYFFISRTSALNIIVIIISFIILFKPKTNLAEILKLKNVPKILSGLYIGIVFILIVWHYYLDYADIFSLPFDLFYILFSLSLFSFALKQRLSEIQILSLLVILIAWTSSVSLGDNSPVFSAGILAAVFFLVLVDINYSFLQSLEFNFSRKISLFLASLFIFALTVYSQRNVNYRDLGYKQISEGLNNASNEFGNIKSNPACVAYYNELADIFNGLPNSKDNTVVIPNNPVFYAIFKTKNPTVLDWIQPDEYIGQDEFIKAEILDLCTNSNTYFIVDKIDSKKLSNRLLKMHYDDKHVVNLVFENCMLLDIDSEFFDVYISKKNSH